MICRQCGKENEDGDRFCDCCGAAMETSITCGQCGKENDTGNKFCIYCGAVIDRTVGVSGGEEAEQAIYGGCDKKARNMFGKRKLLIAGLTAGVVLVLGIGSIVYFTGDSYHCKRAMRLAEKYYEKEEYREALHYYEDALKGARKGIEKTGSEELEEVLIKAYAGLVDQYIADGDYERALKSVKEGIAETGSEELSERRSEVYIILADACAEAEDEEGELQILAEAIETTGETAFIQRQDMIRRRQEEALRQQEEEEEALRRIQEEEQAALQQAQGEEQEALERQEETPMAALEDGYPEEDYEMEEISGGRTDLEKVSDSDGHNVKDIWRNASTYDWNDNKLTQTKSYSWDGSIYTKFWNNVETIRNDVPEPEIHILQYALSKMNISSDITKCSDLKGYVINDVEIFRVRDGLYEYYLCISSNEKAYIFEFRIKGFDLE